MLQLLLTFVKVVQCKKCIKGGVECRVNYAFKYKCLRCVKKRVPCSIGLVHKRSGRAVRCDKKGAKALCETWQDSVQYALAHNLAHPDSPIEYTTHPTTLDSDYDF